jgi:hypothetical protein
MERTLDQVPANLDQAPALAVTPEGSVATAATARRPGKLSLRKRHSTALCDSKPALQNGAAPSTAASRASSVPTAAAVTAAPPLRPPYAGLWNSGRHIAAVVQAIAHCADLAAAVAAAAV